MLATAHAEGGQAARAAELYEALLVQTPSSVPVLNNLAFLYADTLDRPDQALAHARKAKALAPGWPEVSDTLGWVLAKRKEYSEALPLLEQAAKAMAKDPRVLFHLGAAQIGAGQREAGRRTLQRALQAGKPFPESEQAAQLLAAK
jgi:Tfp pilus assembly protein PilF